MNRTSLVVWTGLTLVACGKGGNAVPDGGLVPDGSVSPDGKVGPDHCDAGHHGLWIGTASGTHRGAWLVGTSGGTPGCAVDLADATWTPDEALTWSPDGTMIALVEDGGGHAFDLRVFDVSGAAPVPRAVDVPAHATIAFARSGWLLTATPSPDPIAIAAVRTDVDQATPVPLGTVALNGLAFAPAIAPTGDRFAIGGAGAVLYVDLAPVTGPVVTTWTVPTGGTSLSWSPDGRWLAVGHHDAGGAPTIDCYDTTAPAAPPIHVDDGSGVGETFHQWSPDNHRFTVIGSSGTEVVDIASGSAVVTGSTPLTVQEWVDASRFAVYADRVVGGGLVFDVSIYDADHDTTTPIIVGAEWWNPGPHRGAIASYDSSDYTWTLHPVNGSAPTKLTSCSGIAGELSWSPDDSKVVCGFITPVALVDGATGNVLKQFDLSAYETSATAGNWTFWTPDSSLAWLSFEGNGAPGDFGGQPPPVLLDPVAMTVTALATPTFDTVDTAAAWQPVAP